MFLKIGKFQTYINGSKLIDYALGSSASVQLWKHSELPPTIYYEMDIQINIIFKNFICFPFDMLARGFSSKDIKTAPKYLRKMYKYLGNYNVIQQSNNVVSE